MESRPYHHYLFFCVEKSFYSLSSDEQKRISTSFVELIAAQPMLVEVYGTRAFKAGTTFMLWSRGTRPEDAQDLLRVVEHSALGAYLSLTYTYFGIVKPSVYSGRVGKPEQVMQNYEERLPYLVIYPFSKTHDWYQLTDEERKSIMGEHIKTGIGHGAVRQCLLYAYGIDDYEFLVSYEMNTLEEFQQVIVDMRKTKGRPYTLIDTPIFTCRHLPLTDLPAWL